MNTIIASKLSTQSRTIIPEAVRHILGLHPGDTVIFDILPNQSEVKLRKAQALDLEFAQSLDASLANEWLSEHDEAAYRDL
ncbi:MAG: AbrB family transcriptional regulator [Gammaproteobacteria bacterium]|nr:AbrB family transcriptional regulator [Gammaproteobacteria bacterium]